MGKTPRERILVTLLPAILALCGYMLFFNRSDDLKGAVESRESARSAAVDQDAVLMERMKLADLREKSNELKADKTKFEARRKELALVRQTAPAVRAEALRQLSSMLWSRGLHPFQESPADSSDSQVSPSFDEVIRGLATPTTPTPGDLNPASDGDPTANSRRLWQIRFYGRYNDVTTALESLRDSGLPIIPVSLTMSEARSETTWRSWTLLLWL
jgi:hypothetical protein